MKLTLDQHSRVRDVLGTQAQVVKKTISHFGGVLAPPPPLRRVVYRSACPVIKRLEVKMTHWEVYCLTAQTELRIVQEFPPPQKNHRSWVRQNIRIVQVRYSDVVQSLSRQSGPKSPVLSPSRSRHWAPSPDPRAVARGFGYPPITKPQP